MADVLRSRVSSKTSYTSWSMHVIREQPPRELYQALRAYYLNNGLYDELWDYFYAITAYDAHEESLKPLRNPAYRVVEFYAAKLWPGSLPEALRIQTKNDKIIKPIEQVWTWSNWTTKKQWAARSLAIYGDTFIKVVQSKDTSKVYFQLIEPEHVTDIDVDERGYITYVRIDVHQTRRDGDDAEEYTRTEVWDKATGLFRVWEHNLADDTPIGTLGLPTVTKNYKKAWGIDFIPIVHTPLKDIGDVRGMGAFTQSLDKIDEANRMVTRLHRMLWRYKQAIWALQANQTDPMGRPMPAPEIDTNTDGDVVLGDDILKRLPGNSSLQALVPNLSWNDALAVIQDHMKELEQDLPELAYWRLRDKAELSGRAVQLLMADAVDKILEARGNAIPGLVRANQMALTIGQRAGIEGFTGLGDYEKGDMDHALIAREIIPTPEYERAMTVREYTTGTVPLTSAVRAAGWREEDIADLEKEVEERERSQTRTRAAMLLDAERDFGGGGNGNSGDTEKAKAAKDG